MSQMSKESRAGKAVFLKGNQFGIEGDLIVDAIFDGSDFAFVRLPHGHDRRWAKAILGKDIEEDVEHGTDQPVRV